MCELQQRADSFRRVSFPRLDDILDMQPMTISEMGGADFARYLIRRAEIQEMLADMIEMIDEAEGDGCFFGENDEDINKFERYILELRSAWNALKSGEAKAARRTSDPRD